MAAHTDPNQLFYGDNLHVLREQIADESVGLLRSDVQSNSKDNDSTAHSDSLRLTLLASGTAMCTDTRE